MEVVVTEGTGKPAFKDMPFAVAGKTGTAHVADGNIKYYDMVYQASFVGYFPANNPQYYLYCSDKYQASCSSALWRQLLRLCSGR